MNKTKILEALSEFARQRPGLEFGNYGDVKTYRAEMRRITRDLADFRALYAAVAARESITGEDIVAASKRAYSGRLTITPDYRIEYCTGQYWPTEYRCAACAVLASVLWRYVADHCMPLPNGEREQFYGLRNEFSAGVHPTYDGLFAGDWLRRYFRREFGRGIQSRWFN